MDQATQTAAPEAAATATTSTAEPDVYELARQADAGQEPVTETKSETAQDTNTETATETADSAQSSETTATEANDKKPADTQQNQKQETPFQKAKAETERRERSWKKLEEEKAKFRQEREQWEREKTQQTPKPKDEGPALVEGHSADVWDKVAAKLENDGADPALIEKARANAAQARGLEAQRKQPAPQTTEGWQTPEFQTEWKRNTAEILKAEPELDNPEHPVFKEVSGLLQHKDWGRLLRAHPSGIKAAVEVAKLIQRSAQADKAAAEIKGLKAEIERLNKLTQPRGSLPAGQAPTKRPEDLSDAEIYAAAAAADRG